MSNLQLLLDHLKENPQGFRDTWPTAKILDQAQSIVATGLICLETEAKERSKLGLVYRGLFYLDAPSLSLRDMIIDQGNDIEVTTRQGQQYPLKPLDISLSAPCVDHVILYFDCSQS